MAEQKTQNYGNHTKFPTHYVINDGIALLALMAAGTGLFLGDSAVGLTLALAAAILLAMTAISVIAMTRFYALGLQDRIVRLEMQVRLERVLPDDLKERAASLTLKQLIGLRFASDAEMPELVAKVLDKGIAKGGDIKKLVKDWQPDHQRV